MPLSGLERTEIVAALGPTNTGKTHRAVQRMLEHSSGMIGLPLRLLAREVYDRVTAQIGESRVALVTGEEKRIPARPCFWVCTTEAMPAAREVDFVAVDEIQLAAHPQRGHVFTDRLLHARGRRETWFMGADTMRPMIEQLVPTARFETFPRFSKLENAGSVPLGALPPRTAVVAFTAPQVYEVAERLQRRRGGAAVVLGALSPRTRNAQVALYQAGEVQYLVATDAIGMGLNMNVDLVAFSSLRKFDGRDMRGLEPAELAQIAGRAGRHLNDGTFATLAPLPPLADDTAFALETHRFPPIARIQWRNSELDMSSVDALIESLREKPPRSMLRRAEFAEDLSTLLRLAEVPEIRQRARGAEAVLLLWTVCQIPDYRQLLAESHAELLAALFLQLSGASHRIGTDWLAQQIGGLDDTQGDIETLMARIAFIRTWTYVANHGGWVDDEAHWQEVARAVEDRLSDALHERLMQRFVTEGVRGRGKAPRRPQRAPQSRDSLEEFEEKVPDGPFGALARFRLPCQGISALPVSSWVDALVEAPTSSFHVDEHVRIFWDGEAVGRMSAGVDVLRPDVTVQTAEEFGPGARLRVHRRLLAWTRDQVEELLAPLRKGEANGVSQAGRGLLHQLEVGLGTATTLSAQLQIRALTLTDYGVLRELGVKVGRGVVYVPALLADDAVRLRISLVRAYAGTEVFAAVPGAGEASVYVPPGLHDGLWTSIGYPLIGRRGIRADVAERVLAALQEAAAGGKFEIPVRVIEWLGCTAGEAQDVAAGFGFERAGQGQFKRSTGAVRGRDRKAFSRRG